LLEVSDYGSSTTTNCFAAFDGNGNLAALVNAANGTTLANYEYGPFGEVIRSTGPMARINPFRFSTKYQDDESDLLYYGYRYYKASTGTWVSRDPVNELGFILLKDGWIKRTVIRRTSGRPNLKTCPTCDAHSLTIEAAGIGIVNVIGGANIYDFVNNDPIEQIDNLGLLSPEQALEAFWEALKSGLDGGGEVSSALEAVGGCNGLSMVLAWAETQYNDCMTDAITGDPKQDASAEKACGDKWNAKIKALKDVYDKACKCTVEPEKKHWWWPF